MTEAESALEHIRNRKPFTFGGAEMQFLYPFEFEALLAVAEAAQKRQAIRGPLAETIKERAAAEQELADALAALSAEREES